MSEFGGFNAHELLSRLRSGNTGGGINASSSVSLGGNSIASSTVSHSVKGNNSVTNGSYNGSIQQLLTQPPPDIPSQVDTPFFSQQPKPNNLDVAAQRREAMEIRMELEKEIKRLQEQVSHLKAENKTLKAANAELELKMTTAKQKSDDVIAKLRGKLVKAETIKRTTSTPTSAIASAGPRIGPNRNSLTIQPAGLGGSRSRGLPELGDSANSIPQQESEGQLLPPDAQVSSFAGPTFSELMRRSTAPTNDFNDILRKPHLSTGYTNGSGLGNASKNVRGAAPTNRSETGNYGFQGSSSAMEMSEFDSVPMTMSMSQQPYHQIPSQPHPSHFQHMQMQPQVLYHQQGPGQPPMYFSEPGTPYAVDPRLSQALPPPNHTFNRSAHPSQATYSEAREPARWDIRRAGNLSSSSALNSSSKPTEENNGDDDADDLPVVDIDLR